MKAISAFEDCDAQAALSGGDGGGQAGQRDVAERRVRLHAGSQADERDAAERRAPRHGGDQAGERGAARRMSLDIGGQADERDAAELRSRHDIDSEFVYTFIQ